MYKLKATWNDLAKHINKMSEEEKMLPVLVWGEDRPLCREVTICVENEDMCSDPEYSDEGCFLRSEYDGDDKESIITVVESGKTFLNAD